MKILLLGNGHISKYIQEWFYDKTITIVDSQNEAIRNSKHTFVLLNVADKNKLTDLMKDHDLVVNCLPYNLNIEVINCVLSAQVHYIDLSEDVDSLKLLRSLEGYPKTLIPACGLAPGVVSIIANHMAKKFTKVHNISIRVGALPQNPTNKLGYNLTWSVDGLINEYRKSATIIWGGELTTANGLDYPANPRTINGVDYEEFYTSGGIGTLCETWLGKAEEVDYKTLRYPGHKHLMDFLMNDLQISDLDLRNILTYGVPRTTKDKVVIFICVSGYDDKDQYFVETYHKDVYPYYGNTAIQATTGSAVCAVIEMMVNGLIKQTGFIKQEDLDYYEFMKYSKIFE